MSSKNTNARPGHTVAGQNIHTTVIRQQDALCVVVAAGVRADGRAGDVEFRAMQLCSIARPDAKIFFRLLVERRRCSLQLANARERGGAFGGVGEDVSSLRV